MTTETGPSLGVILKAARGRIQRSLEQVASEVGLSYVTLSRLETGETTKPYTGTLAKLAAYYGLELESLLAAASAPSKSERSDAPRAVVNPDHTPDTSPSVADDFSPADSHSADPESASAA